MDYQALRTEIDKPAYAGLGDSAIAAALNAPGVNVDREVIPTRLIVESIDAAELAALTAIQLQRLTLIVNAGSISTKSANVRAILGALFGPGTATRAALQSLQVKTGSRAEQLFGDGAVIDHLDIAQARKL
jgi:hypothetical protein